MRCFSGPVNSVADNPEFYAIAGNHGWGVAPSVAVTPVPAGDYEIDPKDFSIREPETGKGSLWVSAKSISVPARATGDRVGILGRIAIDIKLMEQ